MSTLPHFLVSVAAVQSYLVACDGLMSRNALSQRCHTPLIVNKSFAQSGRRELETLVHNFQHHHSFVARGISIDAMRAPGQHATHHM